MAELLALETLETQCAVPSHVTLLVALEASAVRALAALLAWLRAVSGQVSLSSAVVAASISSPVSSTEASASVVVAAVAAVARVTTLE